MLAGGGSWNSAMRRIAPSQGLRSPISNLAAEAMFSFQRLNFILLAAVPAGMYAPFLMWVTEPLGAGIP